MKKGCIDHWRPSFARIHMLFLHQAGYIVGSYSGSFFSFFLFFSSFSFFVTPEIR